MPRYIDADVLKLHIDLHGTNKFGMLDEDIRQFVDNVPTADVVEVVRCKDCVHHKNAPKTKDVWCDRLDGLLPKDWFCADGERIEE